MIMGTIMTIPIPMTIPTSTGMGTPTTHIRMPTIRSGRVR
jgi:hypothetical protein